MSIRRRPSICRLAATRKSVLNRAKQANQDAEAIVADSDLGNVRIGAASWVPSGKEQRKRKK